MNTKFCNNFIRAFIFLALSPTVFAGDIVIDSASVVEYNGGPVVRSKMDFKFSDSAIEALQNGVDLYLEFNLKIKRSRKYIWDKRVAQLTKRIKIERHALTDRYVLTDLLDQQRRIFESLQSAFSGINEMSDIPVGSFSELAEDEYRLAVRARLDIESLPAPLRPIAYVSPSWRMSSGWYEWNSVY
ncbi:MAG: DUF4390 domain-containing protein [Pseudomonadota bacterium]